MSDALYCHHFSLIRHGIPLGLAVDWWTDLLYWTNVGKRCISRSTTFGEQHVDVICNRSGLQDIAVHPLEGFVMHEVSMHSLLQQG